MTNPAEFFDDPEFDTTDLLMNEPTPPGHRSGFVAVVGRPNVGKSTLMNHYLGQKIAIVSPKPQTTRNQLLGILTLPDPDQPELSAACPPAQVVFIDTPGMHRPEHKLGEYLLTTAQTALAEADVIVWVVDVSRPPGPEEQLVADSIAAARNSAQNPPVVILVLNKIDLSLREEQLPSLEQIYLDLFPADHWLAVSATRGDNLTELLQTVVNQLPEGPRYFPADQVTDQQLRFIAAELIREAALHILRDEVPHALAVFVTEFTPRHENLTYISADLILERSAHKQIVIGEKGKTLKQIGQRARPEIEQMVGTRVYLELWVKIRPKWRKNINQLRWLGYSTS